MSVCLFRPMLASMSTRDDQSIVSDFYLRCNLKHPYFGLGVHFPSCLA